MERRDIDILKQTLNGVRDLKRQANSLARNLEDVNIVLSGVLFRLGEPD